MIRPPFAEFSSRAIRELTDWIGGSAVWAVRLNEVLGQHFYPAADEAGLARENAWEALGESVGPVYGIALEDLCTRRFEDPPSNVVDDFLKKRGFRLPPLSKVYLEALRDSIPGIYEAVAVRPGYGIAVRDLVVGGDVTEIIEISGSRQIVQWDKLAARIVEHKGQRVFTGGLFPLTSESSMRLIEKLKTLLHGLVEETGVAVDVFRGKVADVMRNAAPMIAEVHVSQVLASLHRSRPKLLNRDGDPYEFAEARYLLASGRRRDVLARLDAEPGLQRTGERPATWDWVAKASEHPSRKPAGGEGLMLDTHPDGDTGRVVLANLKLSGKQFELSVNSRRRLGNARAYIEPLLAGLIGEPEITVKSVDDAIAEQQDEPDRHRRAVPKEVERKILRRYLDSHYRAWLDEEIPALGGKTPREAARDLGGREQLVTLLKELENREGRRAKDTGVGYDARWLWRELGVEHLRR